MGVEGEDARLALWDTASGKKRDDLSAGYYHGFSSNGTLLCLTSEEAGLVLWDLQKARIAAKLPLAPLAKATALVFSPDGKRAAIAGWKNVQLWDLATGKMVRVFNGLPSMILNIDYSPDSRTILARTDSQVVIWDASEN